jgi:ribosomal protein S8E
VQLGSLNEIYRGINHDIWYFVELYRLTKAGGFRAEHVVRLLRIANNDLPLVECKYESLKTDVKTLEEYKRNSEGRLRDLENQITEASNHVEYYRASCRQEQKKLQDLRQKRMKLEAVVSHFENNNEDFLKIGRVVENIAHSTLSDSKVLLKYALLSLVESMKKDPDKYNSLIYNDIYSSTSSPTVYGSQYYAAFDSYGQQQQFPSEYYREACIEMLVDEAEKVFNNLTRECIDGSIADYAASTTSSSRSLQPPSDKK